jgi:hypothetical protein
MKFEDYEPSPNQQVQRPGSMRLSLAAPADADNGLSYTLMAKTVEARHPRQLVNGKLEKHSCCKSNFGWHCACKSWRKSDIEYMGVGITAYFKMLKFMTLLFLWFTILSIPALIFYVSGNQSGV